MARPARNGRSRGTIGESGDGQQAREVANTMTDTTRRRFLQYSVGAGAALAMPRGTARPGGAGLTGRRPQP